MKKLNVLTRMLLLVALLVGSVSAWGDDVIYSETFGTTGNKTELSSYSGFSSTLIKPTSSGWKISDTSTSTCNLTGSSGNCHAYCGSTSDLIFNFGDKLSNYTNVKLSFNYYKGSGNGKANTLKLYISSDGGTTYGSDLLPSNTGASGTWYSVINITIPAAALSNLCIKFSTSSNVNRLDDIKITGVYASSDPSISLSSSSENVTTAEGDGTINVTYTNIDDVDAEVSFYESDGTTTATYDWIIADINASNNLEYAYEANTGVARTAYMKVHEKNTDVYSSLITIAQVGVLFTVTYDTEQENGTLVIKNGDDVVTSGSSFAEGTILTIITTPAENYAFRNWQYRRDGGNWVTNTSTSTTTYTMTDKNVEFRANFDLTYPVNFSVNGQIASTARFANGKKIDFPGSVTEYDGYSFIGWTETPVVGTVAVEPTLVNPATETMGTEEKTYYAVFAKTTSVSATFDPADLTNTPLTEEPLTWKDTDTGIELYLTAGSHYTKDTPYTFTTTAGTNNYMEIRRNDALLKRIVVTTTDTDFSPNRWVAYEKVEDTSGTTVTTSVSASESVYTLNLTNPYESVCCFAQSKKQIRATLVNVDADIIEDLYCTTIPTTVPVTITAAKYATFASNSKLDFSSMEDEGLYAYTATVAGDIITFTKVTGIVPAGTGLLLYAEVDKNTDFIIPATTADATVDVSGNKLVRGTGAAVTSAGDKSGEYNYVLSTNDKGEVNFYLAAGKEVGTNKAYLKNINPTAVNAKFFLPTGEDETDGIRSIENSELRIENSNYYNLAGQRVGKDYKGIVIVNGKKMLNK